MAITYQPIVHAASGPYRGAALVGTHSAVIGWTFDDPALRNGLLGFAIRRTDLDPETGEAITAGIGRFGPYVRRGSTYVSLRKEGDEVLTIGLNRAVALLAEAKSRGGGGRSIGEHPDGARSPSARDATAPS